MSSPQKIWTPVWVSNRSTTWKTCRRTVAILVSKRRNLKTAWQEVTIKVWKKSEVDTPAFRQFLKQALKSYLTLSKAEATNPEDLMPWKQLGRKWHLMKKGLPAVGRGVWDITIVESLLPVVESHLGKCDVDYGIRSRIHWTEAKSGKPWRNCTPSGLTGWI